MHGSRVSLIAGVECGVGLEKQDVALGADRFGQVLDPMGNDDELAGIDLDVSVAKAHAEAAGDH